MIGFLSLAVSPMLVAQDGGDPGTFLLFPYLQGPRDGGFAVQMLSARANLSQALWLAAVAATGLALFAAARSGTRVAAVLPILLGAAIAVPAMPRQLAAAWVEDRRRHRGDLHRRRAAGVCLAGVLARARRTPRAGS